MRVCILLCNLGEVYSLNPDQLHRQTRRVRGNLNLGSRSDDLPNLSSSPTTLPRTTLPPQPLLLPNHFSASIAPPPEPLRLPDHFSSPVTSPPVRTCETRVRASRACVHARRACMQVVRASVHACKMCVRACVHARRTCKICEHTTTNQVVAAAQHVPYHKRTCCVQLRGLNTVCANTFVERAALACVTRVM